MASPLSSSFAARGSFEDYPASAVRKIGTHALQWEDIAVCKGVLRYATIGEGPPLVLLHGLSCSHEWWSRNLLALAAHFRVYTVDLLDPQPGDFQLGEAPQRLIAWMAAVGLEKAIFMGHSMGGYIAAELAADYPAAINKLVLVSPAFFRTHRFPIPSELLRHASDWIPLALAPLLVRNAWRIGLRVLLRTAFTLLRGRARGKLGEIDAPTLIVWGARDALIPLKNGRELQRAVRGSLLHLLPSAAHSPMWEASREFNEVVLDFLRAKTLSNP